MTRNIKIKKILKKTHHVSNKSPYCANVNTQLHIRFSLWLNKRPHFNEMENTWTELKTKIKRLRHSNALRGVGSRTVLGCRCPEEDV